MVPVKVRSGNSATADGAIRGETRDTIPHVGYPLGGPVIKAVLFDLDGTLLDIDLDAFLREYFSALGPVLSELTGSAEAGGAISAVIESTDEMCRPHPGQTNRQVFHRRFLELTGADLDEATVAGAVERFYVEDFPALRGTHGPRAGGISAVLAAIEAGLATGLATNPIFPRAAIDERMRWAGLQEEWFQVVTSYENMHACKPQSEYFAETSSLLGIPAAECLMVGDDPVLDMSATRAGMRTFFVGDGDVDADWTGTLEDLVDLLGRLDS